MGVRTWLMSSANGLTVPAGAGPSWSLPAVLKLILLITFVWVCVKLVNIEVLIIQAGSPGHRHRHSRQVPSPRQDRHF